MKRFILLILLSIILASAAPTAGQGSVLQNVTGCLNLNNYAGYVRHAPLRGTGQEYTVSGGMVVQVLGAPLTEFIPDTSLAALQGVDAWNGYDDVVYMGAAHLGTLVLYDRTDMDYLDIWQATPDAAFVFAFEDRYWFAEVNGLWIYTYDEILALYEGTFGDYEQWASYHWGWHPCAVFNVYDNDFIEEIGEY